MNKHAPINKNWGILMGELSAGSKPNILISPSMNNNSLKNWCYSFDNNSVF